MKEGRKIYESTHPEVVKSTDKTMPTYESDQRQIVTLVKSRKRV